MKKEKTLIVGIVEKQFFKHRVVSNDTTLGEYLYDFYIELLETAGKEIKRPVSFTDIRVFTQTDCSHDVRYFEVPKKVALVIEKYCTWEMQKSLNKFAISMRRQGTDILIQLNKGELTMNDLNKSIEKTH